VDVPEPNLEVSYERSGADLRVLVAGSLDAAASFGGDVVSRIDDDVKTVTIDLSRLEFCDSTGLTAFMQILIRSRDVGAAFTLHRPSSIVREAIKVTGLVEVLPVSD
jgi:anti-sigma B factor antagonist